MQVLSTIQALVFIIKALITTFQFLTGRIKEHEFDVNMKEIKASIEKAQTGPLDTRLEGGKEVEDQINQGVKK